MFARAVRDGYRVNPEWLLKPGMVDRFLDYVSDIVVLTSTDGVDYRFAYLLVAAGTDGAVCFEDPRVQWVADDWSLTYTWLPPAERRPWRIGAHRLRWDGERFWLKEDSARLLGPAGVENKDGVVFDLADGRVALVHRVWPYMHLAVFDSLDALWDADDSYWGPYMAELEDHVLLAPGPGAFCCGRRGSPGADRGRAVVLVPRTARRRLVRLVRRLARPVHRQCPQSPPRAHLGARTGLGAQRRRRQRDLRPGRRTGPATTCTSSTGPPTVTSAPPPPLSPTSSAH